MQPQDAGGGFDWMHGATGIGGGFIGTFLTWFWRAARIEPKIEAKIEAAERKAELKIEEEMGHLRETFDGIRRQIDDNRLHAAENFVRWSDFNRLRQEDREAAEERRQENRQAFDRLERKIDQILGAKQ